MTDTVRDDDKRELSARRGLSSLQKALFGVLALFFAINALYATIG